MSCFNSQKTLCKDIDCKVCYQRSFACSSYSNYWNLNLNNGHMPHEYTLNSHTLCWFTCAKCEHNFDVSLNDISNQKRRLCQGNDCSHCFERSLASHPKAKHWNKEKNSNITPRQIRRNNQKKFWFDCDTCNHSFQTRPNAINYDCWCIYCANLKLCDDIECTICFEKSFASTEKAKMWHPTKTKHSHRGKCSRNQLSSIGFVVINAITTFKI